MWLLALILKLFTSAGLRKITLPVVIVLVVILTSFGLIQYGKSIERQETAIEQTEAYISTREKIDNAAKDNPTGDPAIALERLRSYDKR